MCRHRAGAPRSSSTRQGKGSAGQRIRYEPGAVLAVVAVAVCLPLREKTIVYRGMERESGKRDNSARASGARSEFIVRVPRPVRSTPRAKRGATRPPMRINLVGKEDGDNASQRATAYSAAPARAAAVPALVDVAQADAVNTATDDIIGVQPFAHAAHASPAEHLPNAVVTRPIDRDRHDQENGAANDSIVHALHGGTDDAKDATGRHAYATATVRSRVGIAHTTESDPAPSTRNRDVDRASDPVAQPIRGSDDIGSGPTNGDGGKSVRHGREDSLREAAAGDGNEARAERNSGDAFCGVSHTGSDQESGDESDHEPDDDSDAGGASNSGSESENETERAESNNGDETDGEYHDDGDGDDDDDDDDKEEEDGEYIDKSEKSDGNGKSHKDAEYCMRAKQIHSADQRDEAWMRARVPDSQRVPLDEILVAKAAAGTLTVSDLMGIDATAALRLATVDAARPIVQQWWGHSLRGLPMVAGPDPAAPYALLPHQVDALTWMRGRETLAPGRVYGLRGGVLSMRMGLGKTPTALALALTAPRGDMPTLVVCSRPVLKEWHTSGVAKFFGAVDAAGAPIVRALYLHSDYMSATAMRAIDRQALAQYDFVLTTYDVCAAECRRGHYDEDCLERGPKGRITVVHTRPRACADRPDLAGPAVLYGTCWERVICDESQRFANPTTGIYRAMMALYGRYKWCLTGTPIRNSHTDIWAQLRFVGYTGIASRAVWKRDGPTFYTRHRLAEAVLVVGHQDHATDADTDRASRPLPLTPSPSSPPPMNTPTPTPTQAKATSAVPRLPPLLHREVVVTLSAPERATYDAVQGLARSALDDVRAHTSNFACLLSMFTRMRQVAIGAHIMTVGEDTTTRDSIMRVLRRADDAAAAVPDAVVRGDPGSRPTAATPSGTLTMTLEALSQTDNHTSAAAPQPVPWRGIGRPVPSTSAPETAPSNQGLVTTVTTVTRPRYLGAPTTTTTTTTSTSATHTPPGPDVLRIPMRRRLPQSMEPAASSSSSRTAPIVEILDEDDPAEVAADDARESGMGLAVWCLSRRSRAGTRSAKMRALTRILEQVPADEKVIVFSSFAAALDLAADAVSERLPRMGVVQIDGDTRKADRDSILRAFRAPGGPRVLLMTYKVGAEGINLPEANHCIFLEPWWTSVVQEQAYSRCWRVGQTRPVTVYNIIAAGTAEQRVVRVCHEKSATAAAYMASSAAARRAAATASRRGGEATLDLATLSRIIG
nr:dead-like helicase [Pandoravirus massiliensis]